MRKKRTIRTLLLLLAVGALLFSGVRLLSMRAEYRRGEQNYAELTSLYVRPVQKDVPSPDVPPAAMSPVPPEEPSAAEEPSAKDAEDPSDVPIAVDFEALRAVYGDAVAWIYGEDTPIHYPVVQAADNSYYLRRLPDGTWNIAGSIFMDFRNSPDFSDRNTYLYGHNMQNEQMFGSLEGYREQEYYEEHPTLSLLTPSGDYRVDLIAGVVTDGYSPLYTLPQTQEERDEFLRSAIEQSTFRASTDVGAEEPLLTLSTCAYDYTNARYLVIGVLRPAVEHPEGEPLE